VITNTLQKLWAIENALERLLKIRAHGHVPRIAVLRMLDPDEAIGKVAVFAAPPQESSIPF